MELKTQNSKLETDLLDFYPEILRATHGELVEALGESGISADPSAAIALQVIEWIRKNWGGRTLTRIWWQFGDQGSGTGDQETPDLPGVQSRIDPVKSVRGRELRAVAWGILVLPRTIGVRVVNICSMATVIAVTVERCLALGLVYIPKGEEVDRATRDLDIYRKFKWLGNIDQVIAKHGLSQSQIYTIKKRLVKEKEEREQPPLPGF